MGKLKNFLIPLLSGLIVAATVFAWTGPTASPPADNTPTPLNISSQAQSKLGGLLLNTGGALNALIIPSGNVGIGKTDPAFPLDIVGDARISGTLTVGKLAGPGGGGALGAVNAADISSGVFGANTGKGNYTFPGTLQIGAQPNTAFGSRPTYYLGQITGDNNDWKIYGEGIGNLGRMVLEYQTTWGIADVEPTFIFRQKDMNGSRDIATISNDSLKANKIEANNIWKKIAEVDLNNTDSYLIRNLDGNSQKMYKIFFQGSISANGSDRRILIRLNDSSSGYFSNASAVTSSDGRTFAETDGTGFYVGRNGWNKDMEFTLEYTISTVTGGGRGKTGFGQATFFAPINNLIGYQSYGNYMNAGNITSIWIGTSSERIGPIPVPGTLTGKLIIYAQ